MKSIHYYYNNYIVLRDLHIIMKNGCSSQSDTHVYTIHTYIHDQNHHECHLNEHIAVEMLSKTVLDMYGQVTPLLRSAEETLFQYCVTHDCTLIECFIT